MIDYSKGQIYSIRFYDDDKHIYIGSTVQPLSVRLGELKRRRGSPLSKYILQQCNGNFKACYIELIEKLDCNNKDELKKREREIIRQYKTDINYIVMDEKNDLRI